MVTFTPLTLTFSDDRLGITRQDGHGQKQPADSAGPNGHHHPRRSQAMESSTLGRQRGNVTVNARRPPLIGLLRPHQTKAAAAVEAVEVEVEVEAPTVPRKSQAPGTFSTRSTAPNR